jgi:hypothetical protein
MDIKTLNKTLKSLQEEKLELSKERSEEIISKLIEYIETINADLDDKEGFWKELIGLTDEEMIYFSI